MEHRCGSRYPTDLAVVVSAHAGVLSSPGKLCDISVSGGYIATALPIDALNVVLVQLPSSLPLTRLSAQVVRQTDTGIAVEWQEYVPELVRYLLGPPAGTIAAPALSSQPSTLPVLDVGT